MKIQRLGFTLTIVNLILLVLLLAQNYSAVVAKESAPLLRGRGLEIVDLQGRVRASITIEPAVTMNGKRYPETVLLRLTDPRNGPVVKLTAASDGSALGLSDDAEGGVQLFAKSEGNLIRVIDDSGKEETVKP